MDGVEILGTMTAEGVPWWVFLGLALVGMALLALIYATPGRGEAAFYGFAVMLLGFLLGTLVVASTPEQQIALISDNASYTAIEERYKVTKIDEHLYFLKVKDGGSK